MSKTVRVRIPVVIDDDGNWSASGYGPNPGYCSKDDYPEEIFAGLPEFMDFGYYVRFVDAEIQVPGPATIQGEVRT